MKNDPLIDLGMNGFDEIFMNSSELEKNRLPKIFQIPISEIDEFPGHPFKVKMDEDMDQLVESIKERGVITPVTLRQKEDGRYEIVSGHILYSILLRDFTNKSSTVFPLFAS